MDYIPPRQRLKEKLFKNMKYIVEFKNSIKQYWEEIGNGF